MSVLAIFAILQFAGVSALHAQTGSILTLEIEDYLQLYRKHSAEGNAMLIDVRTPQEYLDGHAEGSVNIDFYSADFRASIERLVRDDVYFLYCRSGSRSRQTLRMMDQMGFEYVYELAGGWSMNSGRLMDPDR